MALSRKLGCELDALGMTIVRWRDARKVLRWGAAENAAGCCLQRVVRDGMEVKVDRDISADASFWDVLPGPLLCAQYNCCWMALSAIHETINSQKHCDVLWPIGAPGCFSIQNLNQAGHPKP